MRTPLPVTLVQSNYTVDNVDPVRYIKLVAEAKTDLVLDITSVLRDNPYHPFPPNIGPIHAGRNVDLVINDSQWGTDQAVFTADGVIVDTYNPPDLTTLQANSGTYTSYFHPDVVTTFSDPVLVAFGTSLTPFDSDYVFPDVTAGNNINIRHPSTASTITFTLNTSVDATLADDINSEPTMNDGDAPAFSTRNHVGEIDLLTNGFIKDTEVSGDLRVGTITSTNSDVTLIAADLNASIFDVTDSATETALTKVDDGTARVVGNNITLTALTGGIGCLTPSPAIFNYGCANPDPSTPVNNYLEIESSYSGHGVLTATALNGVYIEQTTKDLNLNRVESVSSDVALINLNGSILDDDASLLTDVLGNSIDLIAYHGGVGAYTADASRTNDIHIESHHSAGGQNSLLDRLYAYASGPVADAKTRSDSGSVYITQTADIGWLNVLRAESANGNVRLTLVDSPLRTDINLWLLGGGATLDGSTMLSDGIPTANQGRIVAANGEVRLLVGDNLDTAVTSLIKGSVQDHMGTNLLAGGADVPTVVIYGDYGPVDDNPAGTQPGTIMHFRGTVEGHPTDIFGNTDNDQFYFDQTLLLGQTNVYGTQDRIPDLVQAGGDYFQVSQLQTMASFHPDRTATYCGCAGDAYNGKLVRDTLLLDGQQGDNTYVVNTAGSLVAVPHDYIIDVLNSGPLGGPPLGTGANPVFGRVNTLTVNGTADPDTFLLRQASFIPDQMGALSPAFVALLHGTLTDIQHLVRKDVERINYDEHINARLSVNGCNPALTACTPSTDNNNFIVDGNSAITTLDGGAGNAFFQFGQAYATPRTTPYVSIEDQFATTDTTEGWLSSGPNFPTLAHGA